MVKYAFRRPHFATDRSIWALILYILLIKWKYAISALLYNNVNMLTLPSGTGKYTTHGPHYAALRSHYAALGRYIFPYPSGRVSILYHCRSIHKPEGRGFLDPAARRLREWTLGNCQVTFLMNSSTSRGASMNERVAIYSWDCFNDVAETLCSV